MVARRVSEVNPSLFFAYASGFQRPVNNPGWSPNDYRGDVLPHNKAVDDVIALVDAVHELGPQPA